MERTGKKKWELDLETQFNIVFIAVWMVIATIYLLWKCSSSRTIIEASGAIIFFKCNPKLPILKSAILQNLILIHCFKNLLDTLEPFLKCSQVDGVVMDSPMVVAVTFARALTAWAASSFASSAFAASFAATVIN